MTRAVLLSARVLLKREKTEVLSGFVFSVIGAEQARRKRGTKYGPGK